MFVRLLFPVFLLSACVDPVESPSSAPESDAAADLSLVVCHEQTLLEIVNDPDTTVELLVAIGVHDRAAESIVLHRDGADGLPGTADDRPFDSSDELERVYQVGPAAMDALRVEAARVCDGQEPTVVPVHELDCGEIATLEFVNAPDTTYEVLRALGVHGAGARNIVAHRDGPDGAPRTHDDDLFDTLEELDAVPQVGPATMDLLLAEGDRRCK